MTPSGIEPATSEFVAQCLNQQRHQLQNIINHIIKTEHIKINWGKAYFSSAGPTQGTATLTTDINQISWPASHIEVLFNTVIYCNVRIINNANTVIKICVQKTRIRFAQPDFARKWSHTLHETYQLPCVQ
jgi:hypothetical protein